MVQDSELGTGLESRIDNIRQQYKTIRSTDLARPRHSHRGVAAPDVVEVDLHDPHVLVPLTGGDAGVLVARAEEEAGGQEPVDPLLVEGVEEGQEVGEVVGGREGRDLAPLRPQTVLDKLSLGVTGERTW